jgi:phosphoglycerol transferase MdoB-like AlkP superfamily enzyme
MPAYDEPLNSNPMPSLPDFWLKSLGFWAFLLPVHIAVLGVLVWTRGLFTGMVMALALFALALLGVYAVEVLLVWLNGPDVIIQGSHKSRAVRQFGPWLAGLTLGYLPVRAWYTYRDYQFKKFLENLKNER